MNIKSGQKGRTATGPRSQRVTRTGIVEICKAVARAARCEPAKDARHHVRRASVRCSRAILWAHEPGPPSLDYSRCIGVF